MFDIQIVTARCRVLMLLLTVSIVAFSVPLSAGDECLKVCPNDKGEWGPSPAVDDLCIWISSNLSSSETFNEDSTVYQPVNLTEGSPHDFVKKINSIMAHQAAGDVLCSKENLRGHACVCREATTNCVKFNGHMFYLGRAYDEEFHTLHVVQAGCGEDAPTINNRRAGYLRQKSDPGNCIQSTADPANGGATHFWGDCATGKNQQRRVISYHTQKQELQFASNPFLCLVAREDLANGSSITIGNCATATPAQREWRLKNDRIHLNAKRKECMSKSPSGKIVLAPCTVGEEARWQHTWTQEYFPFPDPDL